tara:strand:- start:53 stop:634 length:582 start_codon:yes stop_codon:yes gene_type:complete
MSSNRRAEYSLARRNSSINPFDQKFNTGGLYGFNTDLRGNLGSSEFFKDGMGSAYSDIFTPKEEKKRSGPFDFLKNQITKLQESDDEDNKMADYLKGQSYMPKKKSSRDQLADFVLERFGGRSGFGGFGGAQDVAQGLTLTGQGGGLNQPVVIQGKEGSGGIGGAISGAASGYLGSGFNPLGAVVGGIGGLFG